MTSSSEKHMEEAQGIVRDLPRIVRAGNKPFIANVIARALANAEREGMRRAAEIIGEFDDEDILIGKDVAEIARSTILSEIGDQP